MTTKAQQDTKRALKRAVGQALRDSDRRTVARLRAELDAQKRRRKGAMRRAVTVCRARRKAMAEYRKKRRLAVRDALRAEFDALTEGARKSCAARKARVARGGKAVAGKARAAIQEERRFQRMVAALDRRKKKKEAVLVSRAERARESDDAVAGNLPDGLQTVWQKVRRSIGRVPGMSRTEAFLKWAEEHPGEVVAIQADAAEKDIARLEREHTAALRRTKTKPVPSRDALRRALAVELASLGAKAPRKLARKLATGRDDPEARALVRSAAQSAPALKTALRNLDELKAVPF